MTGWEAGKTGGTYSISVYSNEFYVNVVGNILGTAGYHTTYSSSAGGGDIFQILTTDPLAVASILRHGNYDTVTKGIVWTASILDHNIPTSMFRSAKPAFFGNLTWPPYDPNNPSSGNNTNIPAGYRFVFGVDPPSGPPNLPPIAMINANPKNAPTNTPISFSSAGSYDPEGVTVTYAWTFGDGGSSTTANPTHSFSTNGSFNVRLDVSDGVNTTTTNVGITVTLVGVNMPPTASASASASAGPAPLAVNFSSAGSSDPEGATLTYNWNFGDGTSSTSANPSKTYSTPGVYSAQLTVSDGTNTSQPSIVPISVGNTGSGLVAATVLMKDQGPLRRIFPAIEILALLMARPGQRMAISARRCRLAAVRW